VWIKRALISYSPSDGRCEQQNGRSALSRSGRRESSEEFFLCARAKSDFYHFRSSLAARHRSTDKKSHLVIFPLLHHRNNLYSAHVFDKFVNVAHERVCVLIPLLDDCTPTTNKIQLNTCSPRGVTNNSTPGIEN
jgi:hypothetical protein